MGPLTNLSATDFQELSEALLQATTHKAISAEPLSAAQQAEDSSYLGRAAGPFRLIRHFSALVRLLDAYDGKRHGAKPSSPTARPGARAVASGGGTFEGPDVLRRLGAFFMPSKHRSARVESRPEGPLYGSGCRPSDFLRAGLACMTRNGCWICAMGGQVEAEHSATLDSTARSCGTPLGRDWSRVRGVLRPSRWRGDLLAHEHSV